MAYGSTQHKTLFKGRVHYWICFLLIALILVVYRPVKDFEFVDYDDPVFVLDNPFVQKGLTLETLVWSFTDSIQMTNYWVPLTWLSIIFDFELYGLNAGGYHVTNLIFHLLNTVLLFMVLNRMTGALWQSAFVAALFALHPLHVESVAWVTERKDVLSTFFGMLALYSYAWYVERPGFRRYVWVFAFFVFGLMSKPMLVTLPFVLLLLDYWPLGRYGSGPPAAAPGEYRQRVTVLRLVWEKMPFFMVTLAVCVAAYVTQNAAGAVKSIQMYPLGARFIVTLVSYVSYMGKMCWPYPLAVLYPHPGALPLWQGAGAGLLLLLITFLALKSARRYPWFIIGWLWYLGTLFPVSGLVVIGPHAMADRYTYIPLIGLFIIVTWGASDLFRRWSLRPPGIAVAAIGVLLILLVLTGFQVRYWENSITLFEHTIKATNDNQIAYNNLGVAFEKEGRLDEAQHHFMKALQIAPIYADAHNNLAFVLEKKGQIKASFNHYEEALRLNPNYFLAHNNLGAALEKQGRIAEAITHYKKALFIKPDYAIAHNNLGAAFFSEGKIEAAVFHFREALRADPNHTLAYNNLKKIMGLPGETGAIIEKPQDALKRHPQDPVLHYQLGNLYRLKNEPAQMMLHYERALAIDPEFVPALNRLALVYATMGEYEKTRILLQKSIVLKPDQWEPCYYLAGVFARQNHVEQSVGWLKKAVAKGFDKWDLLKGDKNLENIRGTAYYQELISRR